MLPLPRCHQSIRWVSYDQNWYPDSYIGYTSSSGMRGMLCFWKKKTGRFLWFPHNQNPSPNSVFGANALLSVILVQFSQIPRAIYLNAVVLQNINLHNSRPIIFMAPTRQYQFNFFTFFRKFISMVFFNKLAREKPGKEISRDRKWRIASDPVFHREKARVFIFWRFPCTL